MLLIPGVKTGGVAEASDRIHGAAVADGHPAASVQSLGRLHRAAGSFQQEAKLAVGTLLVTAVAADEGKFGGQVHIVWPLLDSSQNKGFGLSETPHGPQRRRHPRQHVDIGAVENQSALVLGECFGIAVHRIENPGQQ
jgi:hypothetical protein